MIAFFNNGLVSGEIRARQVAEYLNRPLDPPDPENYVGIYVKRKVVNIPDGSYFDILDSLASRRELASCPKINVIAYTKKMQDYLSNYLKRDVVYIPQHHCNFENHTREARPVKTVGFIGAKGTMRKHFNTLAEELAAEGFNFLYMFVKAKQEITRQVVVDFYKNIDIQVYFRKDDGFSWIKDSLKLVNAGSFGIPTVAVNETLNGLDFILAERGTVVYQCKRLRDDPVLYEEMSARIYDKAKEFHISKIAPLYLELENESTMRR